MPLGRVANERLRHRLIGDARVSKADGSQSLAEFEWELIRERTLAGLTAARGRHGGRTFALSKAQVRLAQAAMAHRDGRSATANRRPRNSIARWRRHTRPRAVRRSAPRRRRDRWTRASPCPWVPTLDLARMIVNPRGILSPDGRGDRALVTR